MINFDSNIHASFVMHQAKKTPKGLIWMSEWGSNRHAANIAGLMLIAAKAKLASGERATAGKWSDWARKQLYLLIGDHGRSYVVGFGENPPRRPHHRSSSCPLKNPDNCKWENHHKSQANEIILYGALVGGPNQAGQYLDARSDYKRNEVAIDYNAGFQTSIAGVIDFIDNGVINGRK